MQYLPISKSPWLTYDELVLPNGIIPKGTFDSWKHRGNIRVNCTGGNGRVIMIEFDSLPKHCKESVEKKYGHPAQYIAMQPIKSLMVRDDVARLVYAGYALPNGEPLPIAYQMKYARQCDWLNLISKCMMDKQYVREHLGISIAQLWDNISLLINNDEEKHDLPGSVDRLRRRWNLYTKDGREGLIEAWRFGNDHARKVTPKMEGLILALYRIAYKPTLAEVQRYYNQFIKGELIDLVDMHSGEVFAKEDFYNEGVAYELSQSTITHYLNTPKNKAVIDKERMSALEYNNTYRPHMMRKGPFYAFSKVTMDDTASPFKMLNGDRPATYKMFDVASTAMIYMVMHDEKRPDAALIRGLIMGVIGLIAKSGWKMPAEIEMERAITSSMAGDGVTMDVLSAGAVFPYVRWCKAKNPQEKRAEGFIKQIKYHYHRHREGFQYRPFAKRTENKANEDAKDVLFPFKEIYQFEMDDMRAYNAAPHPDQELYPGMSRWQVLEQCQNPALPVLDLSLVMPYVGCKTKTSVRRMRVQVQNMLYNLPEAAVLADLSDSDVVAYYLPEETGEIPKVYLYQDGKYVCEAAKEQRYQEAKIEQTEADMKIMGKQKAYEKDFDTLVAAGLEGLDRIGVVKKSGNGERRAVEAPEVVGVEAIVDSPVKLPIKKKRELVPVEAGISAGFPVTRAISMF